MNKSVVSILSLVCLIEIYTPQNIVELIGHEFEHVVEQIEGVISLRSLRKMAIRLFAMRTEGLKRRGH